MAHFFGEINSSIILAADLPTSDDNFRVIDEVSDAVDVIKIGSPLVYSESIRVIRKFADRYGKPIFADLKVGDVPHTNAKIVAAVRDHGGKAVMVHGITGPDSIEECIKESQDEVGIIIQLELTNPGGLLFTQPIAEDVAKMASMFPIYGTQAPGNRPDRIAAIRRIIGEDKVIVCCGVGHQGGQHPEVLAAGGNYSIIGRAIYNAKNPREVAQAIKASAEPLV